MRLEQRRLVLSFHLSLRHAADQVRAHIMRLRRGRVVCIAANVEVATAIQQSGVVDNGTEAGHGLEAIVGADDLLNMLRQQVVLRATLEELTVSIDEEHLAAARFGLAADPVCAFGHLLA